jgi:hypothetical protein
MTTCYEFIDIKLSGERIQARPVAWDREIYDGEGNDRKGNPVVATEFHATCPYCGNLVHFARTDIYKDSFAEDNIKCLMCKRGAEAVGSASTIVKKVKIELPSFTPKKQVFIDPIASGLFDVEVDLELLEKVESAESD